MRARFQNASDEHQFKGSDLVGNLALTHREVSRLTRMLSEFAPLAAAHHDVLAGGECSVEVIGQHVDR